MTAPPPNRRSIEHHALVTFDEMRKGLPHPESNLCILWAAAMVKSLIRHGYADACINAGTANFQMLADADDDGQAHTHYSYEWDDDLDLDQAITKLYLERRLPEMHAWATIPQLGIVIDPTTRYLEHLATMAGFLWTAPPPPATLWATADSLPRGWRYIPNDTAIALAYYVLGDRTAKVINR